MRRKIMLVVTVVLVMLVPVSAEEIEPVRLPVPNLLVHSNATDPISYCLLDGDGETLSKRELKTVLCGVEENLSLVRRGEAFAAGMWAGLGVGVAGTVVACVDAFTDVFGDNEWVWTGAATAAVVGLSGSVLCSMFSNASFIKAADNYNLYVLGIPVAGSR